LHGQFLAAEGGEEALTRLRRAESIGRPLGDDAFLDELERRTKRRLRSAKRGPKPASSWAGWAI
jgi:putative transposase